VLARFIPLLPILILVVVAGNQHRLAHTRDLSPWSGGGFGMFASVDSPNGRHLHAYVQNTGVRKEIVFPPDLADEVLRAAVLPTDYQLSRLVDSIATLEADSPFEWDEAVIEVFSVRYDTRSLTPEGVLLRTARFEFPAGP
jgi:hypothetical protein